MKRIVSFFEIPAENFPRTIRFYEGLFQIKLETLECGQEKMAFFPEEAGECPGAISWSAEFAFKPSAQGVLLSLNCENLEKALAFAEENGGKTLIPKTKIEAENRGYFAVILDGEGNRIGLYSDK